MLSRLRERQQRINLAVEAGRQFCQRVAQPSCGVETIERRCTEQALDSGDTLAGALRAAEEPVLLAYADRPE
jgi:hypothetical protein